MTFEILAGILFLLIIITNITSGRFGYETFSNLNSEAKLQKINKDPKKFKIGTILILIEHTFIIFLAIMLFIAFSPYNIILGITWTIFRITEASIQIYNKKSYWKLLNIAKQYSETSGIKKEALSDLAQSILKTKNNVFTFAQILFSIGTLSYSILFVIYLVIPDFMGWFGIIASIIYGIGSGVKLLKPNFKVLWGLGGLLILIFELILGLGLLFTLI